MNDEYYGDVRDRLESFYPGCTAFVLAAIPEGADRHIEISINVENSEESKLFSVLCYDYEDSYNWDKFPMAFKSSDQSGIAWYLKGQQVRQSPLQEGVKHFHTYSEEIK